MDTQNDTQYIKSSDYTLLLTSYKLYLNMIFSNYYKELVLIIFIIYFFNFNFGVFMSIFYLLLLFLNLYENYYFNNIINNVNNNNVDYYNQNNNCRHPTMDNPFANFNVNENYDISACNDTVNLNNMNIFNNFNVYENSSDKIIGSSNKSERDFYTRCTTKYPNNSIKFAKWLYNTNNLTCKENNNCFLFDDIRFHSR